MRAKGENARLLKRTAVLAVLKGKQSTKSKMIMANRRTSAAVTANAVMIRSAMEDRIRPHTAGELNGRKAINRDDMLNALSTIGSNTAAEEEDQGESLELHMLKSPPPEGAHVSTQNIVQEARVLAMQSGGYESQNVGNAGGFQRFSLMHPSATSQHPQPSPTQLPGINTGTSGPPSNAKPTVSANGKQQSVNGPESALPTVRDAHNINNAASLPSSPVRGSTVPFAASSNLATASSFDDDEFDGDNDAFDTHQQLVRGHSNSHLNLKANLHGHGHAAVTSAELETAIQESESTSHLPFCARTRQGSMLMNDSSGENSREQSKKHRRGSLSLRGSLIIPMSSSYVDTLNRSNIAPKSAIMMKLEAAVEKYIHKK